MKRVTEKLIRLLDGMMPETAMVLGSGLGSLADGVTKAVRIPYEELDGFPAPVRIPWF